MHNKNPVAQTQILKLQPYEPGMPVDTLAREYNIDPEHIIKLASNENPYGLCRKAQERLYGVLSHLESYPDQYDLVQALADNLGVEPENLIIGNGSNDVLDIIARVFLGHGFSTVIYQHSFLVYKIVSIAAGAEVIETKATPEYGYDLNAMLQAIDKTTRVVWIDNPNNPTGTFINYSKLEQFIKSIPSHCIVVLDEAYCEYLNDDERVDVSHWYERYPNLIITRTFSKIHAMAGLRLGYGIAHPSIAELLNRVRQPFNVNSLAVTAGICCLKDGQHILEARKRNQQGMALLMSVCDELGIKYIPSHGNFLTINTVKFENLFEQLLRHGIITRPIANYGLKDWLRITIGTKSQIEQLASVLNDLT